MLYIISSSVNYNHRDANGEISPLNLATACPSLIGCSHTWTEKPGRKLDVDLDGSKRDGRVCHAAERSKAKSGQLIQFWRASTVDRDNAGGTERRRVKEGEEKKEDVQRTARTRVKRRRIRARRRKRAEREGGGGSKKRDEKEERGRLSFGSRRCVIPPSLLRCC